MKLSKAIQESEQPPDASLFPTWSQMFAALRSHWLQLTTRGSPS